MVVWKEFRKPAGAEWSTLRETHTFRVDPRDVRKPCPLVESLPEGAADEKHTREERKIRLGAPPLTSIVSRF